MEIVKSPKGIISKQSHEMANLKILLPIKKHHKKVRFPIKSILKKGAFSYFSMLLAPTVTPVWQMTTSYEVGNHDSPVRHSLMSSSLMHFLFSTQGGFYLHSIRYFFPKNDEKSPKFTFPQNRVSKNHTILPLKIRFLIFSSIFLARFNNFVRRKWVTRWKN